MEKPIYKEQGNSLYMINNDIVVVLDLSTYHHGIISCQTADARTSLMMPSKSAQDIPAERFEKHFQEFMRFILTANLNIPLNKILEAN